MVPSRVDDSDSVGIAVEPDAQVRAGGAHGLDEILEILDDRRIGMMIREGSIALAEQPCPLDVELIEELGRHERADAVAAVDDDLEPARELARARDDVLHVRIDDVPASARSPCPPGIFPRTASR